MLNFILTAICVLMFGGFATQPMYRVALFNRLPIQDFMCLTLMTGLLGGFVGFLYVQTCVLPLLPN